MTKGSCLCGAVRYEVDGPFTSMTNCHCSMCRKHHGAAFATFVGAPLAGFRWLRGQSEIDTYRSSALGTRSFCRHCGSVTPTLLPQHDAYPPEFGLGAIERAAVEAKEGVTPGSCLCSDVRFEIVGAPLRMWNCHCSRCRRGRSAMHASNIFYKFAQLRFLRGADSIVDYQVPEARFFTLGSKAPWDEITDRTPQYAELPPAP